MLAEVNRFTGGKPFVDDVCLVAAELPVSYGYFFKNGNGAAVNDVSTHYRGIQVEALAVLRANIRLL